MRMYILKLHGGVYSDFDIMYVDNIEKYFLNNKQTIVFDRIGNNGYQYCPNAFFIANKNCEYIKFIIDKQINYVKIGAKGYNNVGPQIVREVTLLPKYKNQRKNIKIMNSMCYLPLEYNELSCLYNQMDFKNKEPYFGIHWFNGASESRDYIDNFDIDNFSIKCKMDLLVNDYIEDIIELTGHKKDISRIKNNNMITIFTKFYYDYIKYNCEIFSGSTLIQTQEICNRIPSLIEKYKINTILDAGCGNYGWMQKLMKNDINYLGVDIVKEIIDTNKKYSKENIKFKIMDICNDNLPKSDLIICRDTLVLFNDKNIRQTILNFKKSGSRYLLTTNFDKLRHNSNNKTGVWFPLNLTSKPFSLPNPIYKINENCSECNGEYKDKSLDLWDLNEINL
jgi:SAM-dependent methyltransferase